MVLGRATEFKLKENVNERMVCYCWLFCRYCAIHIGTMGNR